MIGLWLLYALQFPEEFQLQYVALFWDRVGGGATPSRLLNAAQRHAGEFAKVPTTYLVLALALTGLILNRTWEDQRIRILLVLTAVVLCLHVLAAGNALAGFYTLYPLVLVFCVMGIGLETCLSRFGVTGRGRWLAVGAGVGYALFILNIAAFSVGPRILAWWFQSQQRDYASVMAPLSARLKPGDQVWGTAVAWPAIVNSGARLDANEWIPRKKEPRSDARIHKYVVVRRHSSFEGMDDYRKVLEFGDDLPLVLGSTLANKSYAFDLWQSQRLD